MLVPQLAAALHAAYGAPQDPDPAQLASEALREALAAGLPPESAQAAAETWSAAVTALCRDRRDAVASLSRQIAAQTTLGVVEPPAPLYLALTAGRTLVLPQSVLTRALTSDPLDVRVVVEACVARQRAAWFAGLPQSVALGASTAIPPYGATLLQNPELAQAQLRLHAGHDAQLRPDLEGGDGRSSAQQLPAPRADLALADPYAARWTSLGDLCGAASPRWADDAALLRLGPPPEGFLGAHVSRGAAQALGNNPATHLATALYPAAVAANARRQITPPTPPPPPPPVVTMLAGLDLVREPVAGALQIATAARAAGEALGAALAYHGQTARRLPWQPVSLHCGDLVALQLAHAAYPAAAATVASSDAARLHDGAELVATVPLWRIQAALAHQATPQWRPPYALELPDDDLPWQAADLAAPRQFWQEQGALALSDQGLRALLPALLHRLRDEGVGYRCAVVAPPTDCTSQGQLTLLRASLGSVGAHLLPVPYSQVALAAEATDVVVLAPTSQMASLLVGALAAFSFGRRGVVLPAATARPADPLIWLLRCWCAGLALPQVPGLEGLDLGVGADTMAAAAALTTLYQQLSG